jgi:Flp pilus assembly protein TadG
MVETAFMLPWIIFLFVGVFDFGFYAYALVNVQNAARQAALQASIVDIASISEAAMAQTVLCPQVQLELAHMPNKGSFNSTCTTLPLIVTATALANGVDGAPAWRVTVSYQTDQLIPIPGILSGRMTFTRTVEMRAD